MDQHCKRDGLMPQNPVDSEWQANSLSLDAVGLA
jgi:hypothetical protein